MKKPNRTNMVWRCTVNQYGRVTEAIAVARAGTDGGGLFFVVAYDEAGARKEASNLFDAERMRVKRAKWKKEKKCTRCGRERDVEGRDRCGKCLQEKSEENKRTLRRKHGEAVPVPSKLETSDRRKREALESERLTALREVLNRILSYGRDDTVQWLRREILNLTAERKEVA